MHSTIYNAVYAKENEFLCLYVNHRSYNKLTVAFLIGVVPIFKLSFYSGAVSFIVAFLDYFDDHVRRIEPLLKSRLLEYYCFKEIFSFSGWNYLGQHQEWQKAKV